MLLLSGPWNPSGFEKKDGALAGMMITGIDGAQYQTSAIDYMEAKGIPVDFDYWTMQEQIGQDPRFWADWARQRDSGLLIEIVDGWARGQLAEAKAWVDARIPKDDKRRADIDELLEIREHPPAMDESDSDEPDTDDEPE